MTVQNPELSDLAARLADAEREIDAARELARKTLHALTDARLALDAAGRELRDIDTQAVTVLAGDLDDEDREILSALVGAWRQRTQDGGAQ